MNTLRNKSEHPYFIAGPSNSTCMWRWSGRTKSKYKNKILKEIFNNIYINYSLKLQNLNTVPANLEFIIYKKC